MEDFLKNHESKLDLPVIAAESGHTIFEFVPNDSGSIAKSSLRFFLGVQVY